MTNVLLKKTANPHDLGHVLTPPVFNSVLTPIPVCVHRLQPGNCLFAWGNGPVPEGHFPEESLEDGGWEAMVQILAEGVGLKSGTVFWNVF